VVRPKKSQLVIVHRVAGAFDESGVVVDVDLAGAEELLDSLIEGFVLEVEFAPH